jgi:hypothetical protein
MKIFNKIFKKKGLVKNETIEANKIIQIANMSAVTYYMPLLDEFPKLTIISDSGLLDEFDSLVTLASVGTIMTQIPHSFNDTETRKYISAINIALLNWNDGSPKQVIEFGNYIKNLTEEKKINNVDELSQSIGTWIFLELYENNPHNIEIEIFTNSPKLFFVLGSMITQTFSNYWKN